MIGAALALHAINWGTGALGLQPLLERGFIVAQRGAGTQLLGELLDRLAHDITTRKGPDGLKTTIQKQGSDDSLHGIRENRALAPKAASIFTAAEPEVITERDGRGNASHVLPANQLRAHASEFPFAPLRMAEEERFADNQSKDGIAQKFKALIISAG